MVKVYSKINEIPNKKASRQLTHGCLVLEGGAFRGVYTQGVLDVLMENDINFDCVIGTSAGALGAISYVSGQIGRSARCNLQYRHDSRFIGIEGFHRAHSLINIDFLLDDMNDVDPLDIKRFNNPKRRYIAVCTDTDNGKTLYFEKGKCHELFEAAKASASMPFISKKVKVEGYYCLDGGCSCQIPYEWALNENYDKIVVIKTREKEYRKELSEVKFATKVYPNEFGKVLADSNFRYNKQCDEIEYLTGSHRIFTIAPSQPVVVSQIEGDMEKLGELYELGRKDMEAQLLALKKYLGPRNISENIMFNGYKLFKRIKSLIHKE